MGSSTSTRAQRPPGPPGHFLWGSFPQVQEDRLAFFTQCAREYGDYVSLRIGPHRAILINDPDAIEYVLVHGARNFSKHFALRVNPVVLGNGLLTSEGDFWLRQRRLAQPAFHRQRIAVYASTMVDHTRRMLAGWQEGQTRDIFREMMALTLGITAKILFNVDADDAAEKVRAALEVAQQSFSARLHRLVQVPLVIPTPGNLRLKRAVRKLDALIYDFIRQRRQSGQDQGNLLSLLLLARDEGDRTGMTDRQLRDEAMTLFLAGHETTALALSWSWYLLARHPQQAARLQAEVAAVLAGRAPTVEDLPHLPYTGMVVSEVLRLYPPAFIIGREVVHACQVGEYDVGRGMTILMSQWVMQRDPRFFDQPEEFRPERWQDESSKTLPRFAYFPFGGGPRRCIGDTFALTETALVLATIAQKYQFTVADDTPIPPMPQFTLRPRDPIRAVLKNSEPPKS